VAEIEGELPRLDGLLGAILEGMSTCVVNGAALEKIVAATGVPRNLVDMSGLNDDLSAFLLEKQLNKDEKPRPSRSARKTALKSLNSHAEKLLAALGDDSAHLRGAVSDNNEAQTFLRVLLRLIANSKRGIDSVDSEDDLKSYLQLFFPRKEPASRVIVDILAPMFERRFQKEATYSSWEGKDGDRTPKGPFVNFVIAIDEHLRPVSSKGKISPSSIAKAIDSR
jgi:hypothetical protein